MLFVFVKLMSSKFPYGATKLTTSAGAIINGIDIDIGIGNGNGIFGIGWFLEEDVFVRQ